MMSHTRLSLAIADLEALLAALHRQRQLPLGLRGLRVEGEALHATAFDLPKPGGIVGWIAGLVMPQEAALRLRLSREGEQAIVCELSVHGGLRASLIGSLIPSRLTALPGVEHLGGERYRIRLERLPAPWNGWARRLVLHEIGFCAADGGALRLAFSIHGD